MKTLLDEFYKTDLYIDKFIDRKIFIDEKNYQIVGITQSGKSKLLKNYLLSLKKSSYIYIDCEDIRIDINELNKTLYKYCSENSIKIVAFDNYKEEIQLVNTSQVIITTEAKLDLPLFETLELYPLDYEEFLAYEHKYDSSALNHFFKLGGLPNMHKVHSDVRNIYIQKTLQSALDDIEFSILVFCAKMNSQKTSAFTIYERLKQSRKISKDKLYKSFDALVNKKYIHQLEKFNHARATKKIYLCDIALKAALSTEKNFARLFENMVYLELLKNGIECFYDENIDFYIPSSNEIILCMPFSDERALFKKLEQLEAFIFSYQVVKITAITMNSEGKLLHPISKVEMLPFDIWALGD